jgi:hypothetical protein
LEQFQGIVYLCEYKIVPMPQIKLINGSLRVLLLGDPVKIHATKKSTVDYANLGDVVIGTMAQRVSRGAWGLVNLLNTVNWDDIINKPATFNSTANSSGNSYFPAGW